VRNPWRAAALLAGMALVAVLLVTCGGDNDATPTPAAPTAEERAAAEPILRAATLPGEDLPEGFTFQAERFLTNEESAAEELDYAGAATVEDFNLWGQILQYEVTYQREIPSTITGATLSVGVTTALFRDSDGAGESFEFVRRQTSDPEYVVALEQQSVAEGDAIRDVVISPISFASVGNDRMAFEATFTAYDPNRDQDLDFISQLIAVRRGRAVGSLVVRAVGSPHPLEEVEDLARALDQRMKDALE
jgi:hypothetical protein